MNTLRQSTWAIPTLLFLTTLTGLLLALIAEGVWDWLAWALVTVPVLVIVQAWWQR